jgi:hypothetical protein
MHFAVEQAGSGTLGLVLAENLVLRRRKQAAPFLVAVGDLESVGRRRKLGTTGAHRCQHEAAQGKSPPIEVNHGNLSYFARYQDLGGFQIKDIHFVVRS